MSSIIAHSTLPLHALAVASLCGVPVTFRPAITGGGAYKIDHRDPGHVTVYVNHELNAAELAARMPEILDHLHRLADERRRPALRVVVDDGDLELTAPARPALRALAGGA